MRFGVALVVLVVGLSGCSIPGIARPSPSPSARPSIGARLDLILDRRSQAVVSGDEKSFLADLDPAEHELVVHEQLVFANLRQLRFPMLRYRRWHSLGSVELARSNPTKVTVAMVVQVDAAGSLPTATGYMYSFLQKGPAIRIVGIEPTPISSLPHDLPWDLDSLSAIRAGSLTLAYDSTVSNSDDLAQRLSRAAAFVRGKWGQRPMPDTLFVFMSRSEETIKRWFNAGTPASGRSFILAGVDPLAQPQSTWTSSFVEFWYPTGGTPDYPNGPDLNRVELVARHEFTHALTVKVRRQRAPAWALEGFANWVMWGDEQTGRQFVTGWTRQAAGQGQDVGQLPDDNKMAGGGGLNYALSQSVFQMVADRWGAGQATDFYVRTISGSTLDEATKTTFNLSGDDFLGQWRAYVRTLR